MWTGNPRRRSSRQRRTRSPTRHSATSSASFTITSVASRHRRVASCAGCATTTAWSFTTLPRTQSHRRSPSSACARDSWGSQRLGSLGPPLPRGAAHALHTGAAGAPRGARQQDVYFAAGVTQGTLHSLHDDFQQHGMGAGLVLSPQRRARPPPYTGKVLRRRPTPGGMACPLLRAKTG
jgi:hypothetical protein